MAEILYTERGEYKVLTFDATIRELHTISATSTSHPVERGVAISDHVQPDLAQVSLEVHVSNTPVYDPHEGAALGQITTATLEGTRRTISRGAKVERGGKVQEAEFENTTESKGANVLQFPLAFDRVLDIAGVLERLCREGQDVTLSTTQRQWDFMLIKRVSNPRDAENGHATTFSVDLEEVRFAEGETVGVPEPLETRAEAARRRGAMGTEDAESEEDVSLAAQLLEGATGIRLMSPRRSTGGSVSR